MRGRNLPSDFRKIKVTYSVTFSRIKLNILIAMGIATTPRKGLTQQQTQYTIADNTTKAIIIQTSFIALLELKRGLFEAVPDRLEKVGLFSPFA